MHPITAEAEPDGKCLQDQIFLVMLCLVLHNTGLVECEGLFPNSLPCHNSSMIKQEQVGKLYKSNNGTRDSRALMCYMLI